MKARAAQIARVTELLSSAATGDLMTPPILTDPVFAPALQVWRELAPELQRTHRLPKEGRLIFVQLCVYMAEWLAAEVDIAENGYTQAVPTVSGGMMERVRPIVSIREMAFGNIMRLSAEFGLTPHNLYSLFKDQAAVAATNPGLFDQGQPRQPAKAQEQEPEPVARSTVVGSAARHRSLPPGSLPN